MFSVEQIDNGLKDVRAAIVRGIVDIAPLKYLPRDCPGAEAADFCDGDWVDFHAGDAWGGYDQVVWFRARVTVPAAWRNGHDARMALRLQMGSANEGGSSAEAQLFVNGNRLQALDAHHREATLPPEAVAADEISLALHAWSGISPIAAQHRLAAAELVQVDRATERFYSLVDTLLRVSRTLDQNDVRRVALVALLDRAWQVLDLTRPGSPEFYASVPPAQAVLSDGLSRLDSQEMRPVVTVVGHSHLDMASPWQLRHTREKAARTFSTVLALMDEDPNLRFAHSSPQLYQMVKEDAPDVYVRIRRQVEEGRWEVLGGSWVEFDAHLPGGEALVRQILLGKRFARREFEVDPKVMWLPDAAGMPGALPQLMAGSGVHYLVMSAAPRAARLPGDVRAEPFPYDLFRWRGLDGSHVLVCTVPAPSSGHGSNHAFQGDLSPERVAASWRGFRQRGVSDEVFLPFGWDNGGGGPTREMLAMARTQARVPGHPAVQFDTPTAFLDRLAAHVDGATLPVWDGEFGVGAAPGGYSAQGHLRRANRLVETLYHDAEWLCSVAAILAHASYPHEALRAGWERLLLLQFHGTVRDATPAHVRQDILEDYRRVGSIGEQALDAAQEAVTTRIRTEGERVVVLNTLPWRRSDVVALPWRRELEGRTLAGDDDLPLSVQDTIDDDGERHLLVEVGGMPSMGYRAYPLVDAGHAGTGEMVVTPRRLENAHYRIELNDAGQITSLFDKEARRQVLEPGAGGNALRVRAECLTGADTSGAGAKEAVVEVDTLVDATVEEAGPVRGTLRLRWRLNESTVTQWISVYRASRRIDFRTHIDWQEARRLLQAVFPVAVRATFATYEVQFGTVERPTHRNTPWDATLAEVPAQRWADLSEGDYGLALLNDGKHGYHVEGNVLALTLCGASSPAGGEDHDARERFTYSLLPHSGTWREADVVREAAALNYPAYAAYAPPNPGGILPEAYEFAVVDAPSVTLETVKRAEDGDGWIVRLYEGAQCRRQAVTVRFGQALRRAVECNLLEETIRPAAIDGCTLAFAVAPHEVKTFRVWFE